MSGSYSLNDSKNIPLDIKLDNIFNKKENGFYIELGAFDGISQSNTAFFEFKRNWKGILIEPSKGSYELCKKNRPNSIVYNYCCVSNDYKEEYISGDFNNITMASVNGNRLKSNDLVSVQAKTLEKILTETINETIKIDFISIDTEGYEFEIIKGLNLDKFRPKYMLIEIYKQDYEKIYTYLINKNYILHSNFTNYNRNDNPIWDGTHNDFLFIDKN
jgi:FkbM family methyltransferase